MSFKLNLYTPQRLIGSKIEVISVTVPTTEGQLQFLEGHAHEAGLMDTGLFSYQTAQGEFTGVISTGFYRFEEGILTVSAETLEYSAEIDLDRAKRAEAKSEEKMNSSDLEFENFEKYERKLQRALVRQQAAGK
ncbi:MAG: hypothetical protein CL678_06255 [Bdellovibrionaceae bacterium]|nr:hypothetical protein [Pseudobdellovibrionaceae bacterium]